MKLQHKMQGTFRTTQEVAAFFRIWVYILRSHFPQMYTIMLSIFSIWKQLKNQS